MQIVCVSYFYNSVYSASLLCDNSNSLTYERRKGAKSNTFTDALQDYIDKMATTRHVLFSKVERNITIAQGKQKRQYQKRKGGMSKSFKEGDVALRHTF